MFCANPKPGRFFSTRCRRCKPCRALRQEDWSARTVWEVLAAEKAVFITLTFRRKPTDGYQEFQLYLKRLRIALCRRYGKDARLRYICASEFGERNGRYHLHGILTTRGCAPPVREFRNRWISGITHARAIARGAASRVGRYVSKYLAKDGRIHASNGFGTHAETVTRITQNVGINATAAAVFEAFAGAQVVRIKEEGSKPVKAPYALRKRRKLSADGPRHEFIRRRISDVADVPDPFRDIWGDYTALNTTLAYIAEAEWNLREGEHRSDDEEASESELE